MKRELSHSGQQSESQEEDKKKKTRVVQVAADNLNRQPAPSPVVSLSRINRRRRGRGILCCLSSRGRQVLIMGKNKTKAQKQKNVFQVANKHIKPKNKAKPVATSLKKINAGNSRKVETINKIFTEVQNEVKSVGKQKSPERTRKLQIPVSAPVESVNMEAATQLFSQL